MANDRMKEKLAEKRDSLAEQENDAQKAPTETIATYLERQKPAILDALPRGVDVDRFTRITLTVVRTNPRLLECNPMSLLAAVMQSAQLGLEPGSGLGEAYIIPYGGEAQFQIGYRGTVKLARNSGDIATIYAEAVYLGDLLSVEMGTEPRIVHRPEFDADGRGTFDAMTHVYAVAKLSNGETQFAIMTKAEIEAHRDRYSKGKSSKDSPWKDQLGAVEMAKKTAVIRLSKMLPLSAEASRAFAIDGTVRRELSRDMSLVPDVDTPTVSASAIGAEQVGDTTTEREGVIDVEPDTDDLQMSETEHTWGGESQ